MQDPLLCLASGITTPGVSEGKHGQHGLSPSTTSSDETIITYDQSAPSLQSSDSRFVAFSCQFSRLMSSKHLDMVYYLLKLIMSDASPPAGPPED